MRSAHENKGTSQRRESCMPSDPSTSYNFMNIRYPLIRTMLSRGTRKEIRRLKKRRG